MHGDCQNRRRKEICYQKRFSSLHTDNLKEAVTTCASSNHYTKNKVSWKNWGRWPGRQRAMPLRRQHYQIKVSLDGSTCTYPWCLSVGMLRSLNIGLSTPTPITLRPLSTYITVPVTAEAKGDAKKAAALPTSSVPSVS